MDLFFILKLLIVLLFLAAFLRSTRPVWAIGLLTVTSAFLLDTFLGSLGREQMLAELGFFFYVISGALFAGAALWLWGILRPQATAGLPAATPADATMAVPSSRPAGAAPYGNSSGRREHAALSEQIRQQLTPEEVRDLIFDLQLDENDILGVPGAVGEAIPRLLAAAEQAGKGAELPLAVERILTPLPAEKLPRREKLNPESPPTVLRHYLLAHYDWEELQQLAASLDIDWQQLAANDKRSLARNLLLYLQHRKRLPELVTVIQQPAKA